MSSDKNMFGGGNPNSLYMPMSETEQEVLERLVEEGRLEVHIKKWGVINKLRVKFGDLRVSIPIKITFNAPDVHIPVYYFDLQLRRSGDDYVIFEKRYDITQGGQPIMVGSGVEVEMVWDIAIQEMDPKFVKRIKSQELGLTTRVGNTKMSGKKEEIYHAMRQGEKQVRDEDAVKVIDSSRKSLY
jgi:hypothetical protein